MKEMFEKMMGEKGKTTDSDEMKKKAKMDMVRELRKLATDAMSNDMKDMRKVSVMAKDEEGLKMGLDKAKEILKKKEDDEEY